MVLFNYPRCLVLGVQQSDRRAQSLMTGRDPVRLQQTRSEPGLLIQTSRLRFRDLLQSSPQIEQSSLDQMRKLILNVLTTFSVSLFDVSSPKLESSVVCSVTVQCERLPLLSAADEDHVCGQKLGSQTRPQRRYNRPITELCCDITTLF